MPSALVSVAVSVTLVRVFLMLSSYSGAMTVVYSVTPVLIANSVVCIGAWALRCEKKVGVSIPVSTKFGRLTVSVIRSSVVTCALKVAKWLHRQSAVPRGLVSMTRLTAVGSVISSVTCRF